ncbi:MAG: hypothetical protein CMD18_01725 [Flavobacteriales bacterium]|nr:hypothetical protein [Flavobacteriales bacterium]
MKKHLLHGLVAGIIAGIIAVIYFMMYQKILFVDFNAVLNPYSIFGACTFSSILMAYVYWILDRLNKPKLRGLVNILIVFFSFLSVLAPISMNLPLDVEFPELFPGLAIPMHFFPALIFFGIQPFFFKPNTHEQ